MLSKWLVYKRKAHETIYSKIQEYSESLLIDGNGKIGINGFFLGWQVETSMPAKLSLTSSLPRLE